MKTVTMVSLLVASGLLLACICWGSERQVVINEVAWGGTSCCVTREWIELLNTSDEKISLEGWRLVSSDGNPDIPLHGSIPAFGYYLLERNDDDAVPGIAADHIYSGALRDGGEALSLRGSNDTIVDTANQQGSGWPAGTNRFGVSPCCSMERVDPEGPDVLENWATFQPIGDEEADGHCGSPKAENAVFNLPPHVEFSVSPHPLCPRESVFFDAGASSDPNGEIVSFAWVFGDGTIGEGQTANHTYSEVGTYTVSLTATDNKGEVGQWRQKVRVATSSPPIVDFSVRSTSSTGVLQSLDELEFIDESADIAGEVVAWAWDLGDGSSAEGESTVHAYQKGGEYIVALTATDDQGETAIQTQALRIANRVPVARFSFTPQLPNEGQEVLFEARDSTDQDGCVVRYEWDFNDDARIDLTSERGNATHAFSEGGQHTVTLRVLDDQGALSLPCSVETYINQCPVAAFQISDFSPNEGEEVRFTDCSSDPDPEGVLDNWRWDFGDGASSEQASASHVYQADGQYAVTLTVTDANRATGSSKAEISVNNLPPVAEFVVDTRAGEPTVPTGGTIELDASASKDQSPDGKIVSYEWDLNGDGSYDESTVEPRYATSFSDDGEYTVHFRVTDDDGAFAVADPITIRVTNRNPECSFGWTPEIPTDAQEVSFHVTARDPDGEIVSWTWGFGDETTLAEQLPTHHFDDDGTYTITLTVRDDDGAEGCYTKQIRVVNAPPIAAFTVSPSLFQVGEVIHFLSHSEDPSPAGQIVHVAWSFGDGVSCPGTPVGCGKGDTHSPSHCYDYPGTYTITLVVIDEDGALDYAIRCLIVSE